jgi:branched-chain amino acid transport system ATP-binding protein
MTDSILRLREVHVRFGGVIACDIDDVDVNRGEVFALIGPNGAGKTSLLNAICGVYKPGPGASIVYTDRNGASAELVGVAPHKIVKKGIARSFQNLGLFRDLSVLDNLMLGRFMHQRAGIFGSGFHSRRMIREETAARTHVEELLSTLGLVRYRNSLVGELPYGTQKRLELGRVLALEPDLMLLDEPMAGMTEDEKQEITELIFTIRRTTGATLVLIEHDMAVVMSISDRILALNFGQVMACGTPAEIRSNTDVIEAYLGAE